MGAVSPVEINYIRGNRHLKQGLSHIFFIKFIKICIRHLFRLTAVAIFKKTYVFLNSCATCSELQSNKNVIFILASELNNINLSIVINKMEKFPSIEDKREENGLTVQPSQIGNRVLYVMNGCSYCMSRK